MTIEELINDLTVNVSRLRRLHNDFESLNIYLNINIDLILIEFVGQYDLLLTEDQKDYIRML